MIVQLVIFYFIFTDKKKKNKTKQQNNILTIRLIIAMTSAKRSDIFNNDIEIILARVYSRVTNKKRNNTKEEKN